MRSPILLFCCILIFITGKSQTPTWSKQISCIVYSHCTSCHNPNGLAPFSLQTYTQAFSNRYGILNAVSSNKMPPYLPDVNYSHLANAKVLSDAEKNLISDWVNGGAPAGDTSTVLPPPVYNQTQVITSPDLTARIPDFTIPNIGADLYQAFVITNPTPIAKYITQVEVLPGNRNIVHHVLVYQDTSYKPVANDSAASGPGYISFGGIGSPTAKLVATWVPGSNVYTLPPGMGIKLNAGARLVVQIHYPNGAAGQMDSTRINLKFSSTTLRDVTIAPVLNTNNMTNGPLFIAADSVRTFYSRYVVPANVTIISVGPHAHLICKKFEVYAKPLIGDTIKLIKIDDWDFHWQGSHNFQKPIKIPAGTVLHGMAYYDNTINNPDNPNSPPQNVSQGEATTDEMMLIYFAYLPYQAGDENIIIDTSSHTSHYLNCEPEPIGFPISLLYFNAKPLNNVAQLNWATAQEKNSSHFDIERSVDGQHFSKIDKVLAANNSEKTKEYSYRDLYPDATVVYYRLKQVDLDGRVTYTPVRKVNFAAIKDFTVFPNPVNRGENLTIKVENVANAKLELVNSLGQIIVSSFSNNNSIINLPINAKIPAGQYVLRVIGGNSITTKKVLIK